MKSSQYILILGLFSTLFLSACAKETTPVIQTDIPATETEVEVIEEVDYTKLTRAEADALDIRIAKSNKETYSNAVQNGDSSLCETIESEDLRYSCTQTALIAQAVAAKDKSLCKNIDSQKGQTNCESKVEQLPS